MGCAARRLDRTVRPRRRHQTLTPRTKRHPASSERARAVTDRDDVPACVRRRHRRFAVGARFQPTRPRGRARRPRPDPARDAREKRARTHRRHRRRPRARPSTSRRDDARANHRIIIIILGPIAMRHRARIRDSSRPPIARVDRTIEATRRERQKIPPSTPDSTSAVVSRARVDESIHPSIHPSDGEAKGHTHTRTRFIPYNPPTIHNTHTFLFFIWYPHYTYTNTQTTITHVSHKTH